MHYLTNTDANEDTEHRVYVAALRSGQNVRYFNYPMPAKDYYYSMAVTSGALNHLACIVGMEDEFDYSKFWQAWRELKGVE